MIEEIKNNYEILLLSLSIVLGSGYSAYKLQLSYCNKIVNFILGMFIGTISILEFYSGYSISINCLIGLISSGSGAMVYSTLIAVLPDTISNNIEKKVNKYFGE